MAYTNETTHYGIPLPLGSDLTTPMDYNESMQNVDTALFESKTDSTSALQKANQLQQDLATTNDNVTAVAGRVTTLEGTSVTQGQAILQNTQDIADVRADALDMIVAKDEGTAQVATVAVNKGEYFRYNDVLYLATSDIAIGDTIVPNENCSATNVGTELSQVNSDLYTKVSITTADGDTYATALGKLKTAVNWNKITEKSTLHTYGVGMPQTGDIYHCNDCRGLFSNAHSGTHSFDCYTINIMSNNTSANRWSVNTNGATYTSLDSTTIGANIVFEIWY